MYLPPHEPLKKGDVYYVVTSNASPLIRAEDEEYTILTFTVKNITSLVCYGEDEEGNVKIHSLKKIHHVKIKALIELRSLYLRKKDLFKKKLQEVETELTEIKKELPYV